MPQMMPINWMFFLMLFITVFILFNMFNFYIINFKNNKMNFNNNFSKNLSWKW
uniref:ATP synthase F0 subunit 8 n=1 Tax=Chibiraga houshuaii TaxID=3085295 RepID=UPI002A820391|nr:ATP synthase F0 subunit 8 [Chibiraga houshuaii]WOR75484.1 ATP synthase F0 subunit 8 [Chibiraga houshuaii]